MSNSAKQREFLKKAVKIIKNFEHNHIFLNNGKIISSNFAFEEENKISIEEAKQLA